MELMSVMENLPMIFGVVGLALIVLSWQFKKPNSIRFLNAMAFIFFAIQLALLQAWTGALMMVVAATYTVLSAIISSNTAVLTFFFLVNLVLGYLSYHNPIDILPIAGNQTGLFSFFAKSEILLRILAPIGTILWAIYNFTVGAYSQFLADLIILTSMGVGFIRSQRKHSGS